MNQRKFSSGAAWFARHSHDVFVKNAQESGYRARSAFKLVQILQKHPIIRPGMTVLDCGAAPGSWSQVVAELLNNSGKILAVDIAPISHIPGVDICQEDIRSDRFQNHVLPQWLNEKKINVIISDMCPNISGIGDLDSHRSMELASNSVEIAKQHLAPKGSLLAKLFTGGSENTFQTLLRSSGFQVVKRVKPMASRKTSSEIFFLGLDFKYPTLL